MAAPGRKRRQAATITCVFYALQCVIALQVARRTGVGTRAGYAAVTGIGSICLVAAAIGAPAE